MPTSKRLRFQLVLKISLGSEAGSTQGQEQTNVLSPKIKIMSEHIHIDYPQNEGITTWQN